MVSRSTVLNWLLVGCLLVGMALTVAIGYLAKSIDRPSATDLVIEPSPPTVGLARITFRLWTPWGEVIGGRPVKIVPRTACLTVMSEVAPTSDEAFVATVRFETTGDCVFDIVVLHPDGSAWMTITERIDDIGPVR